MLFNERCLTLLIAGFIVLAASMGCETMDEPLENDSFSSSPPSAAQDIEGKQAGDPCPGDRSCEDGLNCHQHTHKCGPPQQEGADCLSDRDCRDKLVCNLGSLKPTCQPPASTDQACARDVECKQGLVCNWGSATPTCQPPGSTGSPCYPAGEMIGSAQFDLTDSELCRLVHGNDGFLWCSSALLNLHYAVFCEDYGCRRPPVPYSQRCGEGLVCNIALSPPICTTPSEIGEACRKASDCRTGLYCDWQDSFLCTAPIPPQYELGAGESCTLDWECKTGLFCHPEDGVCTQHVGVGQPCLDHLECKPGLVCYAQYSQSKSPFCDKPGYSGYPCHYDSDCYDGHHCSNTLPEYCTPDKLIGSFCEAHEECQEGLYCYAEFEHYHHPVCDGPGEYGFPCSDDGDCSSPYQCSDSPQPHCLDLQS